MVLEAIKKRKSIRSYLEKEIPGNVLLEVLEAARKAPSASNRQPWKFVVVQDKKQKQKVMEASLLHNRVQPFIAEASAIIAGCATDVSHVMPNGIPSHHVDLSIALEHISLQAAEMDLGTCWIGAFDQEKVKEILNIPENQAIVCLMTLGYPAASGITRKKKALEEIICYNYYKE
ncbi:MAG TPA: nitroreductase family protein [Atribacterota bacterium]|nr:nitroreductase family protein [Atribacterota bacterium]